jgi:ArsR family transcriptional regulator
MYNYRMTGAPVSDTVAWLRASGESSRLRLLALCTEGALSVSELAQALRQSEPRVSRHLRILSDAGLLRRLRQGQWVHYRLTEDVRAAAFVRQLLARLDERDPVLLRDRAAARAATAHEAVGPPAGSPSRLDRALRAFLEASGGGAAGGRVLMVGATHLEMLSSIAAAARECTAIAPSRRQAQAARAFAERRGMKCRVLTVADPAELSEADLMRVGGPFDAVLLAHQAGGEPEVARLFGSARRLVVPGGRLWVFQRYDSLESSRERVVEHPLARLRRLLDEAGLVCERLSPIEADGEHMLAAAARPAGGLLRAGGESL